MPTTASNASENVTALRLFVRAARTGSFSRASRELGLSQPTASRIVATLEKEFGVGLLQKALPILSDKASVIITGSVAASRAFGNMSVYAGTKGALRSMVRSWILDLAERGIRVNILAPGNISTPALDRLVPVEYQKTAFLSGVLPKRLGQPENMANAALFLASDESEFVNGAELLADGGLTQV